MTALLLAVVLVVASCSSSGDGSLEAGSIGADAADDAATTSTGDSAQRTAGSTPADEARDDRATPATCEHAEPAALTQAESGPREETPSALRNPTDARLPEPLVDLDEIRSGGPPPDGIPPIDDPKFVPQCSVDWLAAQEAVLALEIDGDARAYPLQIMTWHELVNDTVGGVAVTVSYCPLCNSAVAYARQVGERTLDFGTSGSLYNSSLVMYDRQTESLWSHFTANAIVGVMVGTELELFPLQTVSFSDGERLVALAIPGTASALDDSNVALGRDVGATGVFIPRIEGGPVTLSPVDGGFRDDETGSTWDILGRAVAGPRRGAELVPVAHLDTFWFAWSAFQPDTTILLADGGSAA